MVDSTARPFNIPPEYASYAEQHNLFDTFKWLVEELIISRPADPIGYMIDLLIKKDETSPKIIVLGPPASGKTTVASWIAKKLSCPLVSVPDILRRTDKKAIATKLEDYWTSGKPLPVEEIHPLVKQRLQGDVDTTRRGWVLEGYPQTIEQARALQSDGLLPQNLLFLDAPDAVLIERLRGKLVDPLTGAVYHKIYNQPPPDVASRLKSAAVTLPNSTLEAYYQAYRRFAALVLEAYETPGSERCKHLNADQPLGSVCEEAMRTVSWRERSYAPHNPRVLILGPSGCGRSTQAANLAAKYQVVNLDMGEIIRKEVRAETKLGITMRPYVEKHMPVPDGTVLQLLSTRMAQHDCRTRGWVLHGYPRTLQQAEQLELLATGSDGGGCLANRVFVLHVPSMIILERLCNQMMDPATGQSYHLVYNPPPNEAVAARLVRRPAFDEARVRMKLREWTQLEQQLRELYGSRLQVIEGESAPNTVFESMESRLVRPLPLQYADKAEAFGGK